MKPKRKRVVKRLDASRDMSNSVAMCCRADVGADEAKVLIHPKEYVTRHGH